MDGNALEMILARLDGIEADLRAMRIAQITERLTGKTPRQARVEARHRMIRDLADATGLGRSWAAASEVLLILCGKKPIPDGLERLVITLQDDEECARSPRAIYRILIDD